jgi:cation diffusion facilitator CzcD-associated flavoprotein CzcO
MPPHHDIAIVGTGFSGLAAAARLRAAGARDLVLLERAADVGGVWRDNSYPGCACDVESPLYSLSFAPHPGWTRLFAGAAEIRQYLRDTADRFRLRPHIRFHTAVTRATWDEAARRWRIDTTAGPLTARVLVSALGAQSTPAVPPLRGIERFRGTAFHSARWDHAHDLAGERVAVVGTGASAIQFIPEIQPRVGRLTVYQRTPAWVVPRRNRPISAAERAWCRRFPSLLKLWRLRLFLSRELLGLAFRHPRLMRAARMAALRHLHAAVADPVLRAKLTPDYEIGCKRILLSNDYYPALTRPNVELVTDRIAEVRERSIVTADGTERPADTIVYGTGFRVTDNPANGLVVGRGGRRLSEAMGDSPTAHLGTTVAGFPNLFVLQGPNTGLGHSSVLLMIEHQIRHVVAAVRFMRANGVAAVEPRAEAQARWTAAVDARMPATVWLSGGCKSWYLDRTGRNSTLWPGSIPEFGRRVGRFRPGEYHLTPAGGGRP